MRRLLPRRRESTTPDSPLSSMIIIPGFRFLRIEFFRSWHGLGAICVVYTHGIRHTLHHLKRVMYAEPAARGDSEL